MLVDVDPQGDLTKMLGLRKPNDLPLTLGNAMNNIVAGVSGNEHPEIRSHHEGFDFVPGNRTLSAIEVGLVNVMSRETVLQQYIDEIKQNYDYVLLDCRPSLGMLVINALPTSCPKEDVRYEMVAGHLRMATCMIAEKEEIPCIVHAFTDEEAIIIMVDSNLQREQLQPSEKASAHKMTLDALETARKTHDFNFFSTG